MNDEPIMAVVSAVGEKCILMTHPLKPSLIWNVRMRIPVAKSMVINSIHVRKSSGVMGLVKFAIYRHLFTTHCFSSVTQISNSDARFHWKPYITKIRLLWNEINLTSWLITTLFSIQLKPLPSLCWCRNTKHMSNTELLVSWLGMQQNWVKHESNFVALTLGKHVRVLKQYECGM